MANTDLYAVARKIARAPYAAQFKPLFGQNILNEPALLYAVD